MMRHTFVNDPSRITKATFRLPKTLLKDAKRYALDNDKTEEEVFNEAIASYLATKKADAKESKR